MPMSRGLVRASQLLVDLLEEREEIVAELRTSVGQERVDLNNLGAILDHTNELLKKVGAKEWMGMVQFEHYEIPIKIGGD